MAVCSTLSSEFSVAFPEDAATLLKFLLTWMRTQIGEHLSKQALLGALRCKKRIACLPLVMQCSAGSSLFFSRPWRTERTEGLWTSCSTNKCDWKGSGVVTEVLVKFSRSLRSYPVLRTHTATGSDCDLDCVPSRLANVFQVQGFVRGLIVAPLNGERRGVDADLDRSRPVGVHLTVFVVVALELKLQVRPARQKESTNRTLPRE